MDGAGALAGVVAPPAGVVSLAAGAVGVVALGSSAPA
jgi:hypothetical protein